MKLTKTTFMAAGILLYIASAGGAFAIFTQNIASNTSSVVTESKLPLEGTDTVKIDPAEPKDQACPLNGAMYTKTEQQIWSKRRPLAILVENSSDARPQSGLIRSDIIYETVAEGGVTRFMPVFLCDAARSDVVVAPVRSVRTYFIDWASEYGETPLFGHVLGANCSAPTLPNGQKGPCESDPRAQAIEQLVKYGWRSSVGNDLDEASVGAKAYLRNESRLGREVATEHSMQGWTEKLWKIGADRGWTNLDPDGVDWTTNFKSWKFKDDAADADRGTAAPIAHDFWDGYKQYDSRWEYDKASNTYKRYTGGEPHTDLETKQQLSAKNVVVQFTKETGPVDSLKHMLYQTTGTGKALVFQDGKVIEANWSKKDRVSRTIFTDKKGQEINFVRGRVWISIVDNSTQVTYPQ